MEEYLRIGVLTSPHGVRGEVSIYPTSEDLDRFRELTICYMKLGEEMKQCMVTGCKYKKNMPVLKFEGIDDIDEVSKLRGTELYVDREHAIALEEGEYFLADIIGFDVKSEGKSIGKIEDYMENGAGQTLLLVKCNDGTTKQIPDLDPFVKEVNMESKTVLVELIKGM